MYFRVISFKHSHLTERFSLLTLIVIGEGIIGLSKSVSGIMKAQKSTTGADIGAVIGAVLLLYLLWMLYFDQLDEEAKMGTIRQQIWALLHFPLHCAIVLTVEGNTTLIPWNSAVQGLKLVWSLRPTPDDAPSTSFADNTAFVSYLNDSMWKISNHFKAYTLVDEYEWPINLTSINNIAQNTTYNSDEYHTQTAPIIDEMFDFAENFVFKAHDATMSKMLEATSKTSSEHDSLDAIYEVYDTVTLYFYICAGAVLLILCSLYWFGKPHHTRSEAGGPVVRVIMGSLLIGSGCLAVFVDTSTSGYKFQQSALLIPVVVLAYLVVIAFDTLFTYFSEHPETGEIMFHRSGREHNRRDDATTKHAASRNSTYMTTPDSASVYSDQTRMIPLEATSSRADPSNSKRSGVSFDIPTGFESASMSAQQQSVSRMSRFKSLKSPAYMSLDEDDDLDQDPVSDDDVEQLGYYDKVRHSRNPNPSP